jgi:hypothetical protein
VSVSREFRVRLRGDSHVRRQTSPEAATLLTRLDAWHDANRRPGLVGRMTERIRENVGRLALAYALTRSDGATKTPRIEAGDALAALAWGDLSERTVLALWAERVGDPERARVVGAVRRGGSTA